MNLTSRIALLTTLAFSATIIITSSCKKKEVIPAPDATSPLETFASLDSYLSSKEPAGIDFVFDANNGATLTTITGSIVTIPPNAFITPSGQAVTGSVNLRVKEVFTNHEMIHSKIFPVSNGYVLNSGGQFYIQASQNGVNLLVANGVFIDLDIPAQALDNQMQLFLAGPVEAVDTINWNPVDSSFTSSGFTFNSFDNSYEIDLDSMGWGNIDAFDPSINYFDCTFDLTGITGLNSSNTTAFAVFKNNNAVWPVGTSGWGGISNNTISETHLADIPLNLVIISVVDGQLYSGLLDVTPQQGVNYSIALQETTSADLDQLILGLP